MTMLRLLLLVLLAASLSAFFPNTVLANDHPWDDSGVDSSNAAGYSPQSDTTPGHGENDEPIIIEVKNFFLRFLKSVFSWDMKVKERTEQVEQKRGRVKVESTFVNVRAKVL